MRRRTAMTWISLAVLVIGGLVLVADGLLTGGQTIDPRLGMAVPLIAIAIYLAGTMTGYRGRGRAALLHLAIWLGIAVVLALAYRLFA
jgi:hypothetical protein